MKSSYFSWFFREASYEERARVFLQVAKQASEDQLAIIKEAKQTKDFVSMLKKMDANLVFDNQIKRHCKPTKTLL